MKELLKTLLTSFIVTFLASYLALSVIMNQYSLPPKLTMPPVPPNLQKSTQEPGSTADKENKLLLPTPEMPFQNSKANNQQPAPKQ